MKLKKLFRIELWLGKPAICIELAVVAIIVLALLAAFTEISMAIAAPIVLAVYFVLLFVVLFLLKDFSPSADKDELNPVLGNVMVNAVQKLRSPIFIVDEEKERIVWFNKATATLDPSKTNLYGMKITELFDIEDDKFLTEQSDSNRTIKYQDRTFRTKVTKIKTVSRQFCLFELTEITELENLNADIARKNLIYAHIVIDNLSDTLQNQQQSYRTASSNIDAILNEWATENDGFLKELDRNHYIFLFEAEKLDSFVIHKFDILDKIRDVRIGEGSLSVTISMGVANLKDATPAKRDQTAREALDMALQRGGDQVVVKSEDSLEFYGGRSKTVQKRTKVRARIIAEELIFHISRSSNVIIMGHRFPDFDAIGSCVGLARIAMFCGVPVNIVMNLDDPNTKICREHLNAEDYHGVFVDPFVALDMVKSDTLLILTDVNNFEMLEAPEIADSCENNIIVIDHHRKTAEFKHQPLLTYIEPSSSSACELVAEMLEQVIPPQQIPVGEANLLLAGILLDTKQFVKNTGTRTFSAALYLRDRGADPYDAQAFFKTNLDDFMREGKFRSNVVVYRKITAIALGEGDGTPEDRIAAAKAADKLLGVEGVQASFALVRIDDSVHISARSSGNINVQLILEELKGGGHFDAAGAQVADISMADALIKLKEAIDHYIDSIAENNETSN